MDSFRNFTSDALEKSSKVHLKITPESVFCLKDHFFQNFFSEVLLKFLHVFFLLLCLKFQQGFPQTFSKIFLKKLLHRNLYESLKKFVNFFSFNYFSMCFTYFMCIKGIFENVVQVRIFFKNILRESSEQSYREYF